MTKVVFTHLQKCGGTTIHRNLRKMYGKKLIYTNHKPFKGSKAGKLIYGNIRNPYAAYVSLWSFGCEGHGLLREKIEKFKPKHLKFYSKKTPENFRGWLLALLEGRFPLKGGKVGHNGSMKRHQIGHLTQRFFRLYNKSRFSLLKFPKVNPLVDKFIRLENLPKGRPIGKKSTHKPTECYYNQATADLVWQRDQYLFTKFGYPRLVLNNTP